jgi:hypothetical protein
MEPLNINFYKDNFFEYFKLGYKNISKGHIYINNLILHLERMLELLPHTLAELINCIEHNDSTINEGHAQAFIT